MFTPPPPAPAYTCQQLFYIDILKSTVLSQTQKYFDLVSPKSSQRPQIRLLVELKNDEERRPFLEKFELLIFRRTIFKYTKEMFYIDLYEPEVPILLNMTEVVNVTVIGKPRY